jgi:hypothetical protein
MATTISDTSTICAYGQIVLNLFSNVIFSFVGIKELTFWKLAKNLEPSLPIVVLLLCYSGKQ